MIINDRYRVVKTNNNNFTFEKCSIQRGDKYWKRVGGYYKDSYTAICRLKEYVLNDVIEDSRFVNDALDKLNELIFNFNKYISYPVEVN